MPKIVLRDKWFLERTYELHEPIIMRNGDGGHMYRLEFVQCGEQGKYQHVVAKVEAGSLNSETLAELQEALTIAEEWVNGEGT